MQTFANKTLFFKPLSAADESLITTLYTNEDTMRFIEPVLNTEQALKTHKSFVKHNSNKDSGFQTWAIYPKNTQNAQAIGFVMLYSKAGKEPLLVSEVGIMLFAAASGKGIATQSLSALINHAFNKLNHQKLNIRFYQENTAMQIISTKLGFRFDDNIQATEQKYPHHAMKIESLSAQHWQSRQNKERQGFSVSTV